MTLVAGFVDAVGYTSLGHLYLSFMSGNTTSWGSALASGNPAVIGWGAAIMATFVVGSILGSLVATATGGRKLPSVLACEFLCLVSSLTLVPSLGRAALIPVALAMGMQNAAHQLIHGSDTGRTFITGTLVSLGHACAQLLLGKDRVGEALTNLATWLAFAGGVFLGAISLASLGLERALFMVTTTLAILVLLAYRVPLQRSEDAA
jgi:uncharacterized membrane protein YoaK (UPF0700 family)